MAIIFNKLQKLALLLTTDSLSGNRIVYDYCRKLKLKWIFNQQIIIHCHLKCRTKHTTDTMYRTITFSVLLQLN